jgi:hypothetical protein
MSLHKEGGALLALGHFYQNQQMRSSFAEGWQKDFCDHLMIFLTSKPSDHFASRIASIHTSTLNNLTILQLANGHWEHSN